jgi:HSP20 family protein
MLLQMDRLTARVTSTRATGCRLETYRDGDTYVIDIDLPGIDPADIDFSVDHHVLTVRAQRVRPGDDDTAAATQECSKQVVLSDTLDVDQLAARYDNGALTLTIPVRAEELARAA